MSLEPTPISSIESLSGINQKFIHAKKYKIKNVNVILLDKRLYVPNYYKLVLKWECIEPRCQSGIYYQKNAFEYFKSKDLHSEHRHIDFDGKNYICMKCNAVFDDFTPIYFHALAHTNIYECNRCDKKFTRSIDLLHHVSSCMKELADSRFTCDRCQATHNNLAEFIEHMKIPHNNPIQPIPPTPPKSNEIFKCKECSFSSHVLNNFILHYYFQHKQNNNCNTKHISQFDCEFCIFSFQQFSDLYDHIENIHANEISAHFMNYLNLLIRSEVHKTGDKEIRIENYTYKMIKSCRLNNRVHWRCKLKFCGGCISTTPNLTHPILLHEHTDNIHHFFDKTCEELDKIPLSLAPNDSMIELIEFSSVKLGHWQGFLYLFKENPDKSEKILSWPCIEKTCEAILTSGQDYSDVKFKGKPHDHDSNLYHSMPDHYKPYKIIKGSKDILIWNQNIYTEKNYNSVLFSNSWHCVYPNCPGAAWISKKTSTAQLYQAHTYHPPPKESDYITGDQMNQKNPINTTIVASVTTSQESLDNPNMKFYCDSCDSGRQEGFSSLNNLIEHLKSCTKKKKSSEQTIAPNNKASTSNQLAGSSNSSNRIIFERRLNFGKSNKPSEDKKKPQVEFVDTGDIFFSKMIQNDNRKNEPFNPTDLSIYPYATNIIRIVPFIDKHPQVFYKNYFYKFNRVVKNSWEWKCTVCQALLKTDFHYSSPALASKHIGPHEQKNKFEIFYLKAFMRYEMAISNISPDSIYSIITSLYDKQVIEELELEKEAIMNDLEKLRKLFQRNE